jgi:glutamate carboxypeptidase
MIDSVFLERFRARTGRMVEELGELVRHESPSRDKAALDDLAAQLATRMAHLGGAIEMIANPRGGNHVLARFPASSQARPALVLGHFDTVWPAGTLERLPFRVEDGRIKGPGVLDMKASLVMLFHALEVLDERGLDRPRPVWVLLTSDEEIGSPSSRGSIETVAKEAAYVLVPEPALPDGSLKTARKGLGRYELRVNGRAAHAGVDPENGVSAVLELAHQVIRMHELADPLQGTTLNVGLISGGTTANVVPAQALAQIDTRVASMTEADRLDRQLRALRPVLQGTSLEVSGGMSRPPMERTDGIASLFQQASEIGRALGLTLTEGSTGGGSDGNFTAALGVPTLDGLGARGGGAHADSEHILMDSLPERAALLASLLLALKAT